MKRKPKQKNNTWKNLIKAILFIAVLVILGFNYNNIVNFISETVEEPQPVPTINAMEIIEVISEEQKAIDAVKKRSDFKEQQTEIENLRAENIYYTEKKKDLEEELRQTELRLEELRAKELELGF